MSQRSSRLARKAQQALRGPAEAEFNQKLGEIKRARDEALRAANIEFENGVSQLRAARTKTRHASNAAFDQAKTALYSEYGDRLFLTGVVEPA